jgi:ADP-ribosylation factor GTPase-activating protein 1
LTAEVEGREYVAPPRGTSNAARLARTASPAAAAAAGTPLAPDAASRKARNEAYFARLHSANETRPADLPPSQGGKYAGFGSTPDPAVSSSSPAAGPSDVLGDLTRDPVAALTKGWGFFATQATKAAMLANEQVLRPTAQKLAEADLAGTAALMGQGVQGVGRLGYENFSRFVEGPGAAAAAGRPRAEPERKDFWESFGEPTAPPAQQKPAALGTSAMKSAGHATQKTTKDDDWANEEWDKF